MTWMRKRITVGVAILAMLLVGFAWADEAGYQSGVMGEKPASEKELDQTIEQEQQEVEQLLGEGKQSQQQRNGSAEQQSQAQQQESQQQFDGQILKEKIVKIKGKAQSNKIILIRTSDGRRIAIDLGPSQNLANVQMKIGQNISVKGRLVRIGDRKVLFAGELTVNGKTVPVRRMIENFQMRRQQNARQRDAGTSPRQQWRQMQRFSGQIVKERDVSVKNTGMRNKIVLIKTPQGKMVVADLGPSEKLGDIQLTANRSINVQGRWVRVGDQPVLLVGQLTVNGRSTPIQHPLGEITKRRSKSMKGEILRTKDVSVKGTQINNKVILLTTEDDHQVLVDLGSNDNLKDVQIEKGKQIQVQGWPIRVGDQLVVLAQSLTMNGKTVEMHRLQRLQQMRQQRDAGSQQEFQKDSGLDAGIEEKADQLQEEAQQDAEQFEKDAGTEVQEEKSRIESELEQQQKDAGAEQESQQ